MDALSDFMQRVPQLVQWGFAGVGALYLGSKAIGFLQLLLCSFVLSGTKLTKYGKPGSSWVVITGASDGLGKEYAYQVAKRGFNLVLVSRTMSKLQTLAQELKAKYPEKNLDIKVLAMDFAENKDGDYEAFSDLISKLDVAILINNVGQSHNFPVPFCETEEQEMKNIITINCVGTLRITRIVAPMLQQRKKGLILTMGSFGGWTPTPLLATYSGSKAFLQQWNTALSAELKDDGVDCYMVLAHLVTTAMSKIRRPSLLIPSASAFVASAVSKIGLGSYHAAPNTYSPYWSHSVMVWAIENIAGVASPLTISINKKMHVDIRKRALRKQAREAKKQ